MKATKKEFIKVLPEIAQKQKDSVSETVEDCFNNYYQEVNKRINEDIEARKVELDTLLKNKNSEGAKRNLEIQHLQALNKQVTTIYEDIKSLL